MYEFLEGHGLIQMILLILFIGLQFKLSLKKDGKQGSIILWLMGILMVLQTTSQSINQKELLNYYSGIDVIVDFSIEAKLYTISLMILGFIHCICRIKVISKQSDH